ESLRRWRPPKAAAGAQGVTAFTLLTAPGLRRTRAGLCLHPKRNSVGARALMTNVLLLGGDADANLGDAGILAATCGCLATFEPRVAITIVSRHRRALPGVARIINPGPASFAALLDAARRQDLIVVGGGGLLQDDDSRIKVPYWASR